VPIDYFSNPIIHGKVAALLGLPNDDYDGVLEALDIDFRSLGAQYRGRPLYQDRHDRRVDPVYGFVTRYVVNQSGGYWDFCDFPLKGAEPEEIASFPVADPDDFDYSQVEARLAKCGQNAVYVGDAGTADIINSTGRLMGMEDTLVNLATDDEATLSYIDRVADMQLAVLERTIHAAKGRVDFLWLGEDLGTQIAPMISLELYRKVLRPRHQRFVDLAKTYGLPVLFHTCGSSSWVYEDFIEMGVTGVDTLQPEAVNMSPEYLIAHFGGQLAFHGCISTAGPLAYGTVDDVERNIKETLGLFRPQGGYFLSPTHEIQDNTPPENVLAMYRTAREAGRLN
jgi:hypothetical protein